MTWRKRLKDSTCSEWIKYWHQSWIRETISVINSREFPVVQCGAGILKRTEEDLKEMDRKLRKLLMLHGAHQSYANTNHRHMKRANIKGMGLICAEECVRIAHDILMRYLSQSKETSPMTVGDDWEYWERRKKGKQKKKYQKDMKKNYARCNYKIYSIKPQENLSQRWLRLTDKPFKKQK